VLRRAGRGYAEDLSDLWSVTLSAPTGAGKTVIASAVMSVCEDGFFSRHLHGRAFSSKQVPLRFERRA